MFWQKCRKVFLNLAFQRSLTFTETQFILNLIYQPEERERESYIGKISLIYINSVPIAGDLRCYKFCKQKGLSYFKTSCLNIVFRFYCFINFLLNKIGDNNENFKILYKFIVLYSFTFVFSF